MMLQHVLIPDVASESQTATLSSWVDANRIVQCLHSSPCARAIKPVYIQLE